MIEKVAKRLKFWSRKMTKLKKSRTTLLIAPSFPCDDYLHPHYSPSAPPLPPWVELDYHCGPYQTQVSFNDEAVVPILPRIQRQSKACYSYQEYEHTVPVPGPGTAYGVVPVTAIEGGGNARGGRAGFFGCLVQVGMHMFGCLFPCLSIREAASARARRRARY